MLFSREMNSKVDILSEASDRIIPKDICGINFFFCCAALLRNTIVFPRKLKILRHIVRFMGRTTTRRVS